MSGSGPVAILTYHSVDDSGSVLSTSPGGFAEQMGILAELGTRVVPLEDLCRAEPPGDTGPRVVITFDDGFRNVYEHALPVLRRHGFPATVFLVTDYCERTSAWPGQPSAIEPRPLLRWSEVRELRDAGLGFGSHTRTHPDLTALDPGRAEEEMTASKKAIEDATGAAVETFAYPYGAHDGAVRGLAARHYRLACTTVLDYAGPGSDPHSLERLDMYYLRSPALFRRLFSPGTRAHIGLRRGLRWLRGRRGRRPAGR